MQFNLNFDLVTVKQNYDHKQIIRDRVRVRQNLSQRHVTLLAKIEPLRNPQLLWSLARRHIPTPIRHKPPFSLMDDGSKVGRAQDDSLDGFSTMNKEIVAVWHLYPSPLPSDPL